MASESLGIKRHCHSCGSNYYDLDRTPITCPYCETVFDPEVLLKSRRVKAVPVPAVEKKEDEPEIETDIEEDLENVDGGAADNNEILDDDSDLASIAKPEEGDDEEEKEVSDTAGVALDSDDGEIDGSDAEEDAPRPDAEDDD